MTKTIIAINLICLTFLMGCGSYEDELLAKQEEAFQNGRACLKIENLHACKDFVESFVEVKDMFLSHSSEIIQKSRDGNETCETILFNLKNLSKMGTAIAER
jgi:hypothetical protein